MPHVIETAKSGRASCRVCRKPIGKGELRFGHESTNQFGDAPSFFWHHLVCAAGRHPADLRKTLESYSGEIPNRTEIDQAMEKGQGGQKPKLPYAERAPTGRSRCLKCEQPIAKAEIRIAVEREVNTGMFMTTSAGFLHPGCAVAFVGDPGLVEQVKSNTQGLSDPELQELLAALSK